MSLKKTEQRVASGISKNDGYSHHDLRPKSGTTAKEPSSTKTKKNKNDAASNVSPNAKSDARPKTAHNRGKPTITQPSRPKSAEDTRLARGNSNGEKPISIKLLQCDTKKRAWENEKILWEKEKSDLQRSPYSLTKAEEDIKTLQKNYNQLQQDMERERNESKREMDKLTNKHTKEIKQLSDTIESLKAEKEVLQTRLSTVTADMLKHENVNITDLSDPDRPTKLQDVYSEIYDNEWTDAFQELTQHQKIPEKDAITILLDILTSSFQNCRDITWGRYERLINVASSIDIEQRNSLPFAKKNVAKEKIEIENPNTNEPSKNEVAKEKIDVTENVETGHSSGNVESKDKSEKEDLKNDAMENVDSGDIDVNGTSNDKSENEKGKNAANENVASGHSNIFGASKDKSENENGKRLKCTIDMSFDLVHEIKGIWRKSCVELKGISRKQIYSVLETCLDIPVSFMPMTSKYLKKCIDLCWKMGVQEKPLHLDSISELNACAGKRFDKDKFRPYTQSGKIVAFVVWPSLYLHEGGPMLVKGIAQGCTIQEMRQSKMHS